MQGAWVAQLVKDPTSAQIMISQLMSSGLMPGSVLTAQSLEPASDPVCVCVSLCPSPPRSLSLSQNKQTLHLDLKKNDSTVIIDGEIELESLPFCHYIL